MASYKVLQDIEAEDKIVGPLTLKQFILALITCGMIYLTFLGITTKFIPILFVSLPVGIFCGILAWPFGRDQPTEVWLGGKMHFWFRPRLRLWNQDGIQELVTVTAPKKDEEVLFDEISQTEVKSRLKALASTLDSRGWAVKNVNVNLYAQPDYFGTNGSTDRLMSGQTVQEVPTLDVDAADDILDESNNAVAQHFDTVIRQQQTEQHNKVLGMIEQARHPDATQPPAEQDLALDMIQQARNTREEEDIDETPGERNASSANWYDKAGSKKAEKTPKHKAKPPAQAQMDSQPQQTPMSNFQDDIVAPQQATADDHAQTSAQVDNSTLEEAEAALEAAHKRAEAQIDHRRMRVIPTSQQPKQPPKQAQPSTPKAPKPVILELAKNNDFSVATLAAQAKRIENELKDNDVVSLH